MSTAAWRAAWPPEPIGTDTVHLWRVPLDLPADGVCSLEKILSEDERERAGRFHFSRDRARFTAGRAALRILLGAYLGKPAREVALEAASSGKPRLAAGEAGAVSFNVSHSRELALLAFTAGREVGVDVEFADPALAWAEVAPGFCTGSELEQLRALPKGGARERFFKIWTAKEARLKASGEGFLTDARSIGVQFDGPVPAAFLPPSESRWRLREIPVGGSFAAALVVADADCGVRFLDLRLRDFC